MFCPHCGAEDNKQSQFCRACGTELRLVRTALERPDAITSSAVTARDEIGQAIAARIKELRHADDLKEVVEDVLPQVEKFLESPEERRLRRFREGIITAAVGLGVILFFLLISSITHNDKGELLTFVGAGGGIVVLLVGLGNIINGRWLTTLPKSMEQSPRIAQQVGSGEKTSQISDRELSSGESANSASVIEGTTRQLK